MINRNLISDTLIVKSSGNIVSDMDGEKVMLSIEKGKYYNLGTTGGAIWDLINEPISISKVISHLTSEFDVEPNDCEDQVLSFLKQLIQEELIQII